MTIFNGTDGDDTFTGGVGSDTVTFAGNAEGYQLWTLSNGRVLVKDIDASDGDTGSDILRNIETLSFADKSYSLNWSSVGGVQDDVLINTTTAFDQGQPSVTALSNGGYVICWYSENQAGTLDIYAQRFDSQGNPLGAETRINSYLGGHQYRPVVAALSNGAYVITWVSDGQDGSGNGIYSQRFDANGNAVGAEAKVNTTTLGDQDQSTITALSDGGYLIVWADDNALGISAQRFDASGNKVGAQTRVDSGATNYPYEPVVALLADGGYAVTWNDGTLENMFVQRFDSAGNKVGSEIAFDNDQAYNEDQTIVALADGGFLIAWSSREEWDYTSDIHAQRFDASGNKVGSEVQLNSLSAGNHGSPVVEALDDGGFIVVWTADDRAGSAVDLYVRRFDVTGQPVGGETCITSLTDASQSRPDISVLSDGSYVVTWESLYQDGSGRGVYSQRFNADGTAWDSSNPVFSGTAGDDKIKGGPGNQILNGLAGNDILSCGDGSDRLDGGTGNDTLNGGNGSGIDVAVFSGSAGGYRVETLADGTLRVVDTNMADGNTGSDILANIERLEFNDVTYAVEMLLPSYDWVTVSVPPEGRWATTSSITTLADGGYLVSWETSFASGDGDHNVFAQRYDADGKAEGGQTRINTYLAGNQSESQAAGLSNGSYVITWVSNNQDGSLSGVYAQRFDKNGAALGVEMLVNTTKNGDQENQAVTALKGGGYVIAWESGDGSDSGIFAQRYNASGQRVGGETRINTHTGGVQSDVAITGLANGSYLVSWYSEEQKGFYAQHYAANGQKIAGETRISAAIPDGTEPFTGFIAPPAIAAMADGGYVISWTNEHSDLFVQRFDAAGNAREPAKALDTSYDLQIDPHITMLSNGSFVVAWTNATYIYGYDDDENYYLYKNFIQRFDTSGNKVGSKMEIDSASAITALQGDSFVATFDSYGRIYTERFDTVGDTLRISGSFEDNTLNGGIGKQMLLGYKGNDKLSGGAGDDVLDGGVGNDVMTGGADHDIFRFTTQLDASGNVDTVNGYVIAEDTIQLDDLYFRELDKGKSIAANFRANATGSAVDSNDYILYETDTGKLFYDADGNGAGAKVLFAIIGTSSHPAVTAAEFVVI